MAEHGSTSADMRVYTVLGDERGDLIADGVATLDAELRRGKGAGLLSRRTPAWIGGFGKPDSKQAVQRFCTNLAAEGRNRHWPQLFYYFTDEPPYPLPPPPDPWSDMRQRGLRWRGSPVGLVTAMSAYSAFGHGDFFDIRVVFAGQITPHMHTEARRLGSDLWTYSFDVRNQHLVRHRFFAGLYTWANRLGGNWLWAYHWIAWWQEGRDEPMPTIAYEARREGIDDYRYLSLLERCAAAKPQEAVARGAIEWLESLRKRFSVCDPHDVVEEEPSRPVARAEIDRIRNRAADTLERLGVPADLPQPERRVARVKDEAAPLRDKSLRECIAALDHSDPFTRRAAAAALFERGPAAAAAVPALTRRLKNPDVRIVSLRALEAIGPAAVDSLDEVARLYEHPDGYVRMAATFCLAAMGPPAAKPLCTALRDEEYPVNVEVAGRALFRLGDAAIVALPQVMEHLIEHPNPKSRYAGSCIVAALGPAAADAVDRLVKRYVEEGGHAPNESRALASIGPAARAAVPALLDHGPKSGYYACEAHYALFCIRGEQVDLDALLELLRDPTSQKTSPIPKSMLGAVQAQVARRLEALGVKAQAAVPEVKSLIDSRAVPQSVRATLRSFLERVRNGEKPRVVMP